MKAITLIKKKKKYWNIMLFACLSVLSYSGCIRNTQEIVFDQGTFLSIATFTPENYYRLLLNR